ncbi:MAG: SDR family oxidoreductase [Bacteroidota bacterium]
MKIIGSKTICNLFIVGANGGIGRQAVLQALEAGHHVTALVRDPTKLVLQHTNLEIIKGDVLNLESFKQHLENKDAVISALGVSGGVFGDKPTTTYSQGNANLLAAMKKAGVTRAFFISASALDISPVLPFYVRFVAKYILQKLLKNMYHDLRIMEDLVKASDINWTIMRPPRLTDGPITRQYRLAVGHFLKNCLKISRADVAHYMVNNLFDKTSYKATVEISY